jgi:hypothetical protein
MRTNFEQLQAKAGGGLGGISVFMNGMGAFCSSEKAGEVKQFFQQHPFPGTERNQQEALESIASCVELRDRQQASLAAWLKQHAGPINASAGGGGSSSGASAR